MKIRKAVFPVAGLGTRFLPATKAIPKEMLPIVDKPLIQYGVEEALDSGIEQIIFVTGKRKSAIEDHFDSDTELEDMLSRKGKTDILQDVTQFIPKPGRIVYTRQNQPLGLGHAIWCARHVVGNEPFAVILVDDLIQSSTPVLAQMIKKFEETLSSIIAVMEVAPADTGKYGILDSEDLGNRLSRVRGMIEKPAPDEAPSNLAIIGRYILTPEIFTRLEMKKKGAGGEIQITDAMAMLLQEQSIYGYRFEGRRFDCGDKAGFQMANITYALERPDIRPRLTAFLETL